LATANRSGRKVLLGTRLAAMVSGYPRRARRPGGPATRAPQRKSLFECLPEGFSVTAGLAVTINLTEACNLIEA
jgi:hypothetical protein